MTAPPAGSAVRFETCELPGVQWSWSRASSDLKGRATSSTAGVAVALMQGAHEVHFKRKRERDRRGGLASEDSGDVFTITTRPKWALTSFPDGHLFDRVETHADHHASAPVRVNACRDKSWLPDMDSNWHRLGESAVRCCRMLLMP